LFVSAVLGMESRGLMLVGKHSVIEMHSSPSITFKTSKKQQLNLRKILPLLNEDLAGVYFYFISSHKLTVTLGIFPKKI
jgi:hypothetical protein